MSFDKLEPVSRNWTRKKDPVRVGLYQIGTSDPRMAVYIDRKLIAQIGGPTLTYEVGLGKGEDRHLLKIAPTEGGTWRATGWGHGSGVDAATFRFLLPPLVRFPICGLPAQACSYEIDKKTNALLISLPSWAWDNKAKDDIEKNPPRRKRKMRGIAKLERVA